MASHSVGSFHNDLLFGYINLKHLFRILAKQRDSEHDFYYSIDAQKDVLMIYDC
jgi:hypothetical protein